MATVNNGAPTMAKRPLLKAGYTLFEGKVMPKTLARALRAERAKQKKPEDIYQLKAAMAAAHPDRGGSSREFIAAREAYVTARRRLAGMRGN
jgi:hypothetical protein